MVIPETLITHRLELLERAVYALQAQQRLLEYRVQYREGMNTSQQHVDTTLIPTEDASMDNILIQSCTQPQTPQNSSGHSVNDHDPRAPTLDRESNFESEAIFKKPESCEILVPNLLDEPNTPTLKPASKIAIPLSVGKLSDFLPLTPSSIARVESSRLMQKEKHDFNFLAPQNSPVYAEGISAKRTVMRTALHTALEAQKKDPVMTPWDGTIAWKFMRLFQNKEEEAQAMLFSSMEDSFLKLSDEFVFQYGLRYLPKADDKDVYRTVRIEGLPESITLDKVLAGVYYGDVYSADLLNTFPITGYHIARIIFLHQSSAMKFCKWAKKTHLTIQGFRAPVTLEKTATYPVGLSLRESISKHNCTRCVGIAGITEQLVGVVEKLVAESYLKDCVETYSKQYFNVLNQEEPKIKITLRFHSMKAALSAWRIFSQNYSLERCLVMYEKDPCNRDPK